MAATSPRCIQQLANSPQPAPTKPFSAPSCSPQSVITAPSSYDSELDRVSIVPLKAEEQSPSTVSSPTVYSTTPSLSSPVSACVHTPLAAPHASDHQTWVGTLLKTKFYGPCPLHGGLRKNDQNLFCINHAVKICQYCHQADHSQKQPANRCTILHVSRYMYHDVLLAKEAAALLDVSDVQSYLNNGNRVVYIDRRAQPKSKLAPHAKSCAVCSRTLQDPYRFCSVFCRLQHANDPAAAENVPVPDASPLLHQVARRTTKAADSHSSASSPSKRTDRHNKKADRSASVSPRTTMLLSKSQGKVRTEMAPPLRLGGVKKSRRKGTPRKSPLSSGMSLMLSYGVAELFEERLYTDDLYSCRTGDNA